MEKSKSGNLEIYKIDWLSNLHNYVVLMVNLYTLKL